MQTQTLHPDGWVLIQELDGSAFPSGKEYLPNRVGRTKAGSMWEVVKMCLAMEYVKSTLVVDGSVGTLVMSHTVMVVLQAKTRKPWEDETFRLSIKLGEHL